MDDNVKNINIFSEIKLILYQMRIKKGFFEFAQNNNIAILTINRLRIISQQNKLDNFYKICLDIIKKE